MSPNDTIAYDLLSEALGCQQPASGHRDQWQSVADADEGFAEYLVRRNVFVPDAPKAIDMVRRGYLQIEGRSLLAVKSSEADSPQSSSVGMSPVTLPISTSPTRIISRTKVTQAEVVSPDVAANRESRPDPSRANAETTGDAPEPSLAIGVGSRLGRCTLTRELGEGGGGTVYEAIHSGLGIRVAVKVLRVPAAKSHALAGLQAEARLLAHLNHQNLVRVYDFDGDGPVPYLILELVEGLTLADLIVQSGGLRPDKAMRIIAATAHGLDAAAGIGIVHRDVKPSNILLDRTGRVKVADLGLAVSQVDRLTAATGATPAAQAGGGGTVAYMAPERFGGRTGADFRSDIYSLGVTLFEAVTGQLPFDGQNAMELMVQHASEPVPMAHMVRPGVPIVLSRMIARMMAKSPHERFESYPDLIAALGVASGSAAETTADQPTTANGSWIIRQFWPSRQSGSSPDTKWDR